MPKITRGGGASHAEDIPDAVEAPQVVEPEQLPAAADSEADTVTVDEDASEAATSGDEPSEEDTPADADEPATPARTRTRRRTGATAGEGG
jgi:hypothetical protein